MFCENIFFFLVICFSLRYVFGMAILYFSWLRATLARVDAVANALTLWRGSFVLEFGINIYINIYDLNIDVKYQTKL